MSMIDESLEHLVAKLGHFRGERMTMIEPAFGDGFALHCLKMVSKLLDDNSLVRAVAKDLSLIIDWHEQPREEHDLLFAVADVEQDLEESLRGFSGLLDLIMEDTRIRRDPFVNISVIERFDPIIASSFSRLAQVWDILLDLEEAFSLEFPKAATTLFLLTLKDIKRDLLSLDEKASEQSIADWLDGRIKNEALAKLFEQARALPQHAGREFEAVFTYPDLVVVLLCLWSVDGHVLDHKEADQLDRILRSMRMLGIKPLVEAGFLELAECARGDMRKNFSPKVLSAT